MIPSFLTHYYEAERGPFKNICDLAGDDLDRLISAEKDAGTTFNRFALGREFFEIRRAADNLLIEKYSKKFGFAPQTRPFYAVLGEFERTSSMYRDGRSLRINLARLPREHVTFMYPAHFALVWSRGLFAPPPSLFPAPYSYSCEPFHDLLFTYDELPEAVCTYCFDARITRAKQLNMWVSSYIEAHIWDPDIQNKILKSPGGSTGL
jgi:hypothetical protein